MGLGDPDFRMDDRLSRALHIAKVMGLKAGSNPMFRIPRYQVQHGASGGLPAMLWPDVLHTLLKGFIEVCIGWSLQIIQRISLLDEVYRSAKTNIPDESANNLRSIFASKTSPFCKGGIRFAQR